MFSMWDNIGLYLECGICWSVSFRDGKEEAVEVDDDEWNTAVDENVDVTGDVTGDVTVRDGGKESLKK